MRPLFVLGVQRSGTTWLANLLCNHSRVFGVQAQEHFGIVESWYFSHLDGRFGDLRDASNYQHFLETFTRTAHSQCSGIDPARLAQWQPKDYADFFHQFMVAAASQKQNGDYWLDKTPVHTLYADKLARYYPDARFVLIKRPFPAVFRSARGLQIKNKGKTPDLKPRWKSMLVSAFYWAKYQKYVDSIASAYPSRTYGIDYDMLVDDSESVVRGCLNFLEVEWEAHILEQRYERNTSSPGQQHTQMPSISENRVKIAGRLCDAIPLRMFQLQEALRHPRTHDPIPFLIEEKPT